ncbi:MAG: holo-ACP synthase [Melioribacteraceae bacterium]|nr:holo-ACP synthase [Melioribacteraceae bacterium]
MILGVGIDIIEIERIRKSIDNYGEKFLNKIYTNNELEYSSQKVNKYQHLAARFAAKEAIAKALSYSGEEGFNWKDIEIYNEKNGMPKVKLFNKLNNLLGSDKIIHISMSHSENYVTCFALLELKEGN